MPSLVNPNIPLIYDTQVVKTPTVTESLEQIVDFSQIAGNGAPTPFADKTGEHVFRQTSQPTAGQGAKEGDLWFDTDDNNKPYKLVSRTWTSIRDGSITSTPSLLDWAQNMVWTATDSDTLSWGAGTISLASGTSYSINAGNTGNITSVTYIYLDTDVSTTVLQTTTTPSTSVGLNKILIAVAKPNSDAAKKIEFQAFGTHAQSIFITANNIAANTITVNELTANSVSSSQIQAGAVTAGKISVSQLSAISADLGTVTAGSLSINGGVASISSAGVAVFSDIQMTGLRTGSVLDGQYLSSNSVVSSKVNASIRGWTVTCVFSLLDADTVQWSAGSFILSDGTSYSIGMGNTGNMASRTYIYLDVAISTIAFQVTTTASTAVGDGKVLVATAINGTVEPTFEVFSGVGGANIDGSNIVASSITGNEIAANTITANKLSVSQLSAITADLGSITAGTVTGATIRTAASGSRVLMDTTQLVSYDDASNEVFKVLMSGTDVGDVIIGNESGGKYIKYDKSASNFIVKVDKSNLKLYDAVVAANATDGDYTTLGGAITAGKTRIFIRDGSYTESSTVTISTANTIINGESYGGVIIITNATPGFTLSTSDVVFENIIFRQNTTNGTTFSVNNASSTLRSNINFTRCRFNDTSAATTSKFIDTTNATPRPLNFRFINCDFSIDKFNTSSPLFTSLESAVFSGCRFITGEFSATTPATIRFSTDLRNCQFLNNVFTTANSVDPIWDFNFGGVSGFTNIITGNYFKGKQFFFEEAIMMSNSIETGLGTDPGAGSQFISFDGVEIYFSLNKVVGPTSGSRRLIDISPANAIINSNFFSGGIDIRMQSARPQFCNNVWDTSLSASTVTLTAGTSRGQINENIIRGVAPTAPVINDSGTSNNVLNNQLYN